MNRISEHSSIKETIISGGTTTVLSMYFYQALADSIIWVIIGFIIIFSDLYFGIEAARYRKEKVRFSRAVRRTGGKICEYLCWIMLAITLSMGFEAEWLKYTIFAIIYGNEVSSCLVNYFESKGKKISFNIFKLIGSRMGIKEIEDIDIKDIADKKN